MEREFCHSSVETDLPFDSVLAAEHDRNLPGSVRASARTGLDR